MVALRLVVVALVVAAHVHRGEAGCNIVPFSMNVPTSRFHSTRGALQSPFLIPNERLLIERRPCDKPPNATFPALADVRIVLMLQAPTGQPRAFVLKQGVDGPCNPPDAFTTACGQGVASTRVATCLSVNDLKVTGGNVVDVNLPVFDPTLAPILATGGRVVVAVADQSQKGTDLCTALSDYDKSCTKAIQAVTDLPACIDGFVVPSQPGQECAATEPNDVFAGPTLLPPANDSFASCATELGGDFCAPPATKPLSEFRYALDANGNILVPVDWQNSEKACPSNCSKLRIQAELLPPVPLDLPDNRVDAPLRNYWLQSYTMQGGPNDPDFAKMQFPADNTRGFYGTSDVAKSVLRFRSGLTMCPGTQKGCEGKNACGTGVACESRCPTDYTQTCGPAKRCPQNGVCGKAHDHFQNFIDGRWRLDRVTPKPSFCEDDPGRSCHAPADCSANVDCVSYRLTLGGCDCTKNVLSGAVVPTFAPAPLIRPVLGRLTVPPTAAGIVSATSLDEQWLAVIVPRSAVQDASRLPESCRAAAGSQLLAMANRNDCGAAATCRLECAALDRGELLDQLAMVESQARFLQLPPGADGVRRSGRAQSCFARLFGWAHATEAAPSSLPALGLVDARHPAVVTKVPDVVVPATSPAYDPMVVASGGATRFRIRAGQCVRDGRILGIPSLCHPDGGECPSWSHCEPADVAIVLDLSEDRDDDGIPDRLDPFVEGKRVAQRTAVKH